jgi:hypothetical protein
MIRVLMQREQEEMGRNVSEEHRSAFIDVRGRRSRCKDIKDLLNDTTSIWIDTE